MQQTHIIYIPGFGDSYNKLRRRLLSWWHFKNVTIELLEMNWENNETFEQKLTRISQAIDAARGRNQKVALLGESAGGSMVVHAYATRQADIFKAVTICGKNSQPETVAAHYFATHPAFRASMDRLNHSLTQLDETARRRFISIHPLYDATVPVKETLIPGCREVNLWSIGHSPTIFAGLTIWARKIVREIQGSS